MLLLVATDGNALWSSCAARGDYYEHGWPSSWEVREDFWPDDGYIVSKVAVGAMTRVQQRRFDADGRSDLIVNCVHPGYVRTDATLFHGDKSVEEGPYRTVSTVRVFL